LLVGQQVTLCIRPERVRITCREDKELDNHLEGSIVNTIFKGPAVHYQVRVPGDHLITIQQNLEQDMPLYTSESKVYLGWSSENCIVLPE
jgi:ABC-type Fe3+/spermidine/putrescine transport system ATPase subunit